MTSSPPPPPPSEYRVHVLFDGYCRPIDGGMAANCSCTLIRGPKTVVVDTMTPWDGPRLTDALAAHGVRCADVDYVVSTHGHSDHVGNNNLFLGARHVVGRGCVSHRDAYYDDADTFGADGVYAIDEHVRVVATPGHTLSDVSVLVRTADRGTVAVAGDLFECEADVADESVWLAAGSEDPDAQRVHRRTVLEQADWIVPGHGPMFSTAKYKNSARE